MVVEIRPFRVSVLVVSHCQVTISPERAASYTLTNLTLMKRDSCYNSYPNEPPVRFFSLPLAGGALYPPMGSETW